MVDWFGVVYYGMEVGDWGDFVDGCCDLGG